MGTRNLTMVVKDGQFKVAQYGQWDGYPQGQGATVLEFLKGKSLSKFRNKLDKVRFATPEDMEAMQSEFDKDSNWMEKHPEITRDTGAEILDLIQKSKGPVTLKNALSFAGDSLFCEYAYLIDLDKNMLEVYKGFNKSPLENGQRFKDLPGLEKTDGYEPIRMVKSYPLDNLPTVEQMAKDVDPPAESEE